MIFYICRETLLDDIDELQIAIVIDKLPHNSKIQLRMANGPRPEPELQGENVPFEVYSFGEESSARWANLDYDERVYEGSILVINSDSELQKYVEGDYPPVDFSKKTLLLAFGCVSGGFFDIEVKFKRESDQNYMMMAIGTSTILDYMGEWEIAIVVDKLPHNSKIQIRTVDKPL
jgi:hypothetical protein